MAFVYSMKPIGKTEDERNIVLMFEKKAPFKINSGSGAFRIFLTEVTLFEGSYKYKGTASDCEVEGFYNQAEGIGTVVFLREVGLKYSK